MYEKEKIEALTKPFLKELIKKRPHDGVSYVEAGRYVQRLNKAFGHVWDLEILDHWTETIQTKKGEKIYVMAKIRLTCAGVSKESFGGHMVTSLEIADAYKSAVTDGMKKAAWMFGVGVANWLEADEDLCEEKNYRKDLGKKIKVLFESAGLGATDEDLKIKRDLFKKHFGTTSFEHVFSTFPIDELEKCIEDLEKDLASEK